jgi:N-acetylmuramoyl-L-alanine amidase
MRCSEKKSIEKILHEPRRQPQIQSGFFSLIRKVETTVFNLKKVEDKPYRIVTILNSRCRKKGSRGERRRPGSSRGMNHRYRSGQAATIRDCCNGGIYEKDVVLEIIRKHKLS